ncbi:hypothetical protein BJ138DRAFT_1153495 [Hygrophoropsis aurantiaca]|uniref:Uncharacterized protein n=1 Tax=Hygrophoropsis aurantiaca TaxID=72124 RepID=A0ACB8AAS3_9AGAM|nr:hypothetical protein BJ138DRAFT_1153495 [Hygrophoropsis aurantiaca]
MISRQNRAVSFFALLAYLGGARSCTPECPSSVQSNGTSYDLLATTTENPVVVCIYFPNEPLQCEYDQYNGMFMGGAVDCPQTVNCLLPTA